MRKLVTMCLLTFTLFGLGQTVVQYNTYTKEKGPNGEEVYFRAELADVYGYIKQRGPNLTGSCKLMMQNGGYTVANFNDGIMQGHVEIFDPTGKKLHEYEYDNGLMNGVYKQFSTLSDAVITDGNYNMGKKDGSWKYYDDKGKLYKEEDFINGVLTKYKTIDMNNEMIVADVNPDGQFNGKYLKYIDDHLSMDCNYTDGLKDGPCLTYSIVTDKLVKSEEFTNDKLNGITTKYDYLGYKTFEQTYQDNKLIQETAFKPDGSVKYTQVMN